MLRIAIVEDEKDSLDRLTGLIKRYEKERGCECGVSVFGDGMNFVSDYCRVYDVVFMDIEMPFLDGMHAARKLRELDPSVMLVFVTRLASYALAGYEVDAAGYIVKPVEYPSLSRRLDKAVRAMQTRAQWGRGVAEEYFVRTSEGTVRFMLDRLMYVEVIDHFLIYHTADASYRTYGRISEEEKKLPSDRFFRCSKSYIVNLAYVTRIARGSVTVAGEDLPVGRAKKKELMAAFGRFVGGTPHA